MAIIVADHYRTTVKALAESEIIIAMAHSLPDDFDLESHEFMMNARRTYKERGGKVDSHIGGPAEAIRLVLGK